MNERDDEIAKLIYGTQATYQEMQFAALIRADEREACAQFLEHIDLGNLPPDLALYYASLINFLVNKIRERGST